MAIDCSDIQYFSVNSLMILNGTFVKCERAVLRVRACMAGIETFGIPHHDQSENRTQMASNHAYVMLSHFIV